jgi:hypothetical protein
VGAEIWKKILGIVLWVGGGGARRTSLASSRVNRTRLDWRGFAASAEIAAAAAAVTATTSGSVMVVACEVSMAEESKTDDGSGEPDCCRGWSWEGGADFE